MSAQPVSEHSFTSNPQTVRALLLCLGIEQGYVNAQGQLTPLGEQYLNALHQAGELNLIDAPNRLDPTGGLNWSDIPDF